MPRGDLYQFCGFKMAKRAQLHRKAKLGASDSGDQEEMQSSTATSYQQQQQQEDKKVLPNCYGDGLSHRLAGDGTEQESSLTQILERNLEGLSLNKGESHTTSTNVEMEVNKEYEKMSDAERTHGGRVEREKVVNEGQEEETMNMNVEQWSKADVAVYFAQHSLQEFADLCVPHYIDGSALCELNQSDLEKLGLKIGTVKNVLRKIRQLKSPGPCLKKEQLLPMKMSIMQYASDERKQYTCAEDIINVIKNLTDNNTNIDKQCLDEAVKSSCAVGQVLKLNNDSEHRFNMIYIRYDYENIWKKILAKNSMGVKRFILTGSPGIGKSCFIGYIIVQILKQTSNTIIVYSLRWENATEPEYFIITKDKIKSANEVLIYLLLTAAPFEGLNVIWLMDAKEHGPYQSLNSNVAAILFASFSGKNYKDFKTHAKFQTPTMMYLPWWSQTDGGQLVGLNNTSHEQTTAIDNEFVALVELYCQKYKDLDRYPQYAEFCNIAGPNPRNVFETSDIESLKSDINGKANATPLDLTLIVEHLAYTSPYQHAQVTETENYSSKIFCVLVDRNSYLPTGKVIYVSQYASDMLCLHFKKKDYVTQTKYLRAKHVSEDSVKWGQTFESRMHTFFLHCTKKKFSILSLNPQRTPHNSGHKKAELILPSFDEVKRISELDPYLTPVSVYYQPISHQHFSVDSFFVGRDGTLHLFQFTTSHHHPVMAQGLYNIITKVDYTNVKLIFVVPSAEHCLPQQNIIENVQTITNQNTRIHKALTTTQMNALNVITQWKLEVKISDTTYVNFL